MWNQNLIEQMITHLPSFLKNLHYTRIDEIS